MLMQVMPLCCLPFYVCHSGQACAFPSELYDEPSSLDQYTQAWKSLPLLRRPETGFILLVKAHNALYNRDIEYICHCIFQRGTTYVTSQDANEWCAGYLAGARHFQDHH